MGGLSLEVMNPSHTRGLLRCGKGNMTQRLRIKFLPPFYAGRYLAGWRGLETSFLAEAKGRKESGN